MEESEDYYDKGEYGLQTQGQNHSIWPPSVQNMHRSSQQSIVSDNFMFGNTASIGDGSKEHDELLSVLLDLKCRQRQYAIENSQEREISEDGDPKILQKGAVNACDAFKRATKLILI